jgi:hypothetical protein
MPDIILDCGQAVLVDDEDHDFVASFHWYTRDRHDRPRTIIRDEKRGGRIFRVFLHRAIAIRVRPDLLPCVTRMRVKAINGDFTDVRRCNLKIELAKAAGRARYLHRPEGSATVNYKARPTFRDQRDYIHVDHLPRDHSPLWSGGLQYRRNRSATVDGSRAYTYTYFRRVVVDGDGPCGGGIRGNYGRLFDHHGRRGADSPAEPEVQLLGANEGGGVLQGLDHAAPEDQDP